MSGKKYIGIENELCSFKNGEKINFGNYFNPLKKSFDYSVTGTESRARIRTETGHGFYVDGSEIEILTPPVQINKGFATRLTDLLMIGRGRVIKSVPELEYTGYSMHWNITNGGEIGDTNFCEGVAIPFHLFGLTPLSLGLLVHSKDDGTRYEIRGDSINNEDQINATALLLGAYAYTIESERETPLKIDRDSFRGLFLPNGRFDEIAINNSKANFEGNIQVQQYIELFYHWIKPFVNEFGTEIETKNLEEFIYGTKKLEFDNFKYYADLKDLDAKANGVYLPITENIKNPVHVLKSGKERDLPLEGRLLGEIAKQKTNYISDMRWNHIEFNNGTVIDGIGEIYEFAQTLDKNLPKLEKHKIEEVKPNKIEVIEPRAKIWYNPENDNSMTGFIEEVPTTSYYVKQKLKKKLISKKFLKKMVLSAMLAGSVGLPIYSTYHKIDTSYQADKIVNEATTLVQEIQDDKITEQESLEDIENGKNNR